MLEDQMKTWKAGYWSGKERDHITFAHTWILRTLLHESLITFIATEFSAVSLFGNWIVFDIGFVLLLELKAS